MTRQLHIIAGVFMVLPLVYLACVWPDMPAIVPTHFDINGKPDDYGEKQFLILPQLILTAMNMGMYLLLCNVHRIDPKKHAVENKGRMQKMAMALVVFIVMVQLWILYSSQANALVFDNIVFIGVGILFAIVGNYMNNIKPNYFAGIRLPWTLENEENWRKTHQLAGWLWFSGGLVIALCSIFLSIKILLFILFPVVLMMVIGPAIYSYRLYKKHNA